MNKELLKEICNNNTQREKNTFAEYACFSSQGVRLHKESKADERDDIRSCFFRDTDRIIHSSAYTRYVDKTQVFYLFENDHLTHRVLHVQLVSKIARSIGRVLRLNEDLIEAIALGHDLGHPPYGHDGERILDALCKKAGAGSFAHNVQSIRAMEMIENKGKGLNLTLQVLDGILCHNGEMLSRVYKPNFSKTVDDFKKEYDMCLHDLAHCKRIFPMTLEACVVRICDVIAYIGRDVEDAVRVNVIKREDLPQNCIKVLGETNDSIVNTLVNDLIEHSYGKPYLEFSKEVFDALIELKNFNYQKIYACPAIKTQDHKIRNMYNVLFNHYVQCFEAKDTKSAVYKYFTEDKSKEYIKTTPVVRLVCDFIAGMTDDYFNHQFMDLYVPKSFGYSLPKA